MAAIFNIFNETESNNLSLHKGKEKSQTLASSKIKSIENPGFTLTKALAQSQKPKGLSIRSKSDLNISSLRNQDATKANSKEFIKPLDKQTISNKQSPIHKMLKSKSSTNLTTKKLSPKISSPILKNVIDDSVFVKPATPKNFKKPNNNSPENMKYDFDQYKFIIDEMENIFNEDRVWLRSQRKYNDSLSSLEDDGFLSDPDFDSFETTIGSPIFPLSDVELVDISDDED